MMDTRIEAWNWQCWRVLKDGVRQWVGFFESEKDALKWAKTQKSEHVINNVPPNGRLPSGRKDPTWSAPVLDTATDWTSTSVKRVRPKIVSKPVAPPRVLTPEEIALRDEAAAIFEQHKAAEAAELEEA